MSAHPTHPQAQELKQVILLINYANDNIVSMERFAELLARELTALNLDVQILRPKAVFGGMVRGASGLGKWLGYIDKWLLFPLSLPTVIRQNRGALFHVIDHSNSPYLRHLRNAPAMITCNDMLAIRSARGEVPENPVRWTGRRLQAMIAKGLGHARFAACISGKTAEDFRRLFPEYPARLQVIPMGQNVSYGVLETRERNRRLQGMAGLFKTASGNAVDYQPVADEYLLHVGNNAWYKNRTGLLKAYLVAQGKGAVKTRKLLLVGPALDEEQRELVLSHKGASTDVLTAQGLSSEQLEALYNAASAVVFPSIAEGFGWPLVEAQACGTCVITSADEPMRTVSGPAALHVDVRDAEALATAMQKVCAMNDTQRKELLMRGKEHMKQFEPAAMAKAYCELYKEVILEFYSSRKVSAR